MKFLILEPSPLPFSSILGPNIRLGSCFQIYLGMMMNCFIKYDFALIEETYFSIFFVNQLSLKDNHLDKVEELRRARIEKV